MSKRKLPAAPEAPEAGRAAGKQRLQLPEEEDVNDDLLHEMLGDGSEAADAEVDRLSGGVDSIEGGIEGLDAEDLLANLEGQQSERASAEIPELPPGDAPSIPELPVGDLPPGIDATALASGGELDLSAVSLSTAQARRLAPMVCENAALSVIKFSQHELPVGELREEDELEWDSEEYTDVEAILIAEFLKHSTKLTRLDLARNQISDEGAIALATALCANSSIEYLNLESNNLSGTAGSAFCKAVEDNSSLQYLNIMYNALPTTAQQMLRDSWSKSRSNIGLHL
mmetsp:Transcript_27194/g.87309  ORF Transcript_27194/g.87309 Transcript_27194/m.87309 type:complete len:285 (-) Transcript_27194:158-1012(-)